jgi:hypothetical protein
MTLTAAQVQATLDQIKALTEALVEQLQQIDGEGAYEIADNLESVSRTVEESKQYLRDAVADREIDPATMEDTKEEDTEEEEEDVYKGLTEREQTELMVKRCYNNLLKVKGKEAAEEMLAEEMEALERLFGERVEVEVEDDSEMDPDGEYRFDMITGEWERIR